jgi:hypothetical protein
MLFAFVSRWLILLGRILTLGCRYTSSATYFGLALPRDTRPRDLKLVNANIPTLLFIVLIKLVKAL